MFWKRDYSATLVPGELRLQVKGGTKLLDAALAAGLDWPHDCRVGSCGTCRCRLRSGQTKALTDFSYTLSNDEIRAGMILACQTRLKSDVVIDVTLGQASVALDEVSGRISTLRALTHDILEVQIQPERRAFASARAGQYAEIEVPGIDGPRSYSFALAPAAAVDGSLVFFIRHVPGGAFTDWLFGADRRGAQVTMRGPFGAFHYRDGGGRMICIAGGSGLAPIHALLAEAAQARVARECVVLFGARTQADLYHLEELAALGARWAAGFSLIPVLSAEPADSDWRGERGFVTDTVRTRFGTSGLAAGDQGYLCGPPAMVDAGVDVLQSLGLAGETIFFDRFLDASSQPGGRAALPRA